MGINAFLLNFKEVDANVILVIFHVIGAAIGAGGAMMSDFLFFNAIKDKKISSDEFSSLVTVSKAIWAGLLILILSGLGLFTLVYLERGSIPMLSSPRWQTKLTLVVVVILNGIFFRAVVFSRMKKLIDQSITLENIGKSIWYFAASGVISITAWYTIIIISLLPRSFRVSYALLIGFYLLIVICGTLLARYILARKFSA